MTRTAIIGALAALAACGDGTATPADAGADVDATAVDGPRLPDAAGMTVTAIGYPADNQEAGDLLWVAYQDGDGAPWQRATSDGAGTYTLALAHAEYTLAYVCHQGTTTELRLLYASVAEIAHVPMQCWLQDQPFTLSGAVAGVTPGDVVDVAYADHYGTATGTPPTYALPISPGVYDVFAIEHDTTAPHRVLARRDVTIGGDYGLDLDLVAAVPIVSSEWTADAPAVVYTGLWANRGGVLYLWAPDGSWSGVPAAVLAGNDVHVVSANDAFGWRSTTAYVRAPRAIDFVLPPALDAGAVTATVDDLDPYPQLVVTAAADPAACVRRIAIGQNDPLLPFWNILVTAARAPGGALAFTAPDLSAVPGFDPGWAPAQNVDLRVNYSARTANRPDQAFDVAVRQTGDSIAPPPGLDGLVTSETGISARVDLTP